jgi:hypothetical protein
VWIPSSHFRDFDRKSIWPDSSLSAWRIIAGLLKDELLKVLNNWSICSTKSAVCFASAVEKTLYFKHDGIKTHKHTCIYILILLYCRAVIEISQEILVVRKPSSEICFGISYICAS